MSPSAKGTHSVSEKNFNHNLHISTVIAPEAPTQTGGAPSSEITRNPNNKKRNRILGAAGVVAGGAALATSLFVGINSLNQNQGEEAPTGVETSEPVDSEPSTKTEKLPGELDLSIPAGLDTEDVSIVVLQRFNSWSNAGGNNQELYDEWRETTDQAIDFAGPKAEEFAPIFADALFIEDWRSNPELAEHVEDRIEFNTNILTYNLATGNPENDKVPFTTTLNFADAREISSDETTKTRVIEIDARDTNNADMNRVGEFEGQTAEDVRIKIPELTITVTLVTVGDEERIASIAIAARK